LPGYRAEDALKKQYLPHKNQRTTHDDSEGEVEAHVRREANETYIFENERIFQRAGASEWGNSVLRIPSNVQNNKVGVDMTW
jgi:hypothetical protein